MNLMYGRGGLRVDVRFCSSHAPFVDLLEVLVVEETAGGDAETGVD